MKIEEDKEPQRDRLGFPYQRPSPRPPLVIMTARIRHPGQLVKEENVMVSLCSDVLIGSMKCKGIL